MAREDPITVLYMITDSGIGGTEKMLCELILRVPRERFRPVLVVLKKPGRTAELLKERGIEVHSLELPAAVSAKYFLKMPAGLCRLVRIIKKHRPAIIHSFLFQANLMARVAAAVAKVPINISSIRVMEMERSSHAPLDRLTSFMVTRYTAVSEEVKNHVVHLLSLPPEKVIAIPNGIDLERFVEHDARQVRGEFGLDAGMPLIGTVGRLAWQKGQDVLVKALPIMIKDAPELRCMIIGHGPERERLSRLVEKLGIAERVVFAGERTDVPRLLSAFDVFVLPSRWEGMPNAVLEAMAARKPVVASAVGGCMELMVHGQTGVLIPPDDPELLARAVLELLKRPATAAAMGQAGWHRVVNGFTVDSMVERNIRLYEELLKDSGRRYEG